MLRNPYLAARSISSVVGLSTGLSILLLVGVPILIIASTGLLCFYFVRARAARRARNRSASKSSQKSSLMDGDQEMALTDMKATFRPLTANAQQQSHRVVAPTDMIERRVVAGHVKGAGSEVYDVEQYEAERVRQRSRDMVLPSPTGPPIRPRTAPTSNRPQQSYPEFNPPYEYRGRTGPEPPYPAALAALNRHSRSSSLGRPAPIRPPRPTHSPGGSIRSLSIFPSNHRLNAMGSATPSPSHLTSPTFHNSNTSPPPSPSPPLLSPLPYGLRSPPRPTHPPQQKQHSRHPSMDRNSLMPIAPILLPVDAKQPKHVLPTVEERSTSAQEYNGGYEGNYEARYYHNGNYI